MKSNPVPWAAVRLLEYDSKRSSSYFYHGGSNYKGDYILSNIPKGKYILVVLRPPWEISFENDFVATYFPNVIDISNAQPIEIGDPPIQQTHNIVLSHRNATKMVSGKIEFLPNTPIPDEVFVEYEGAIYFEKECREDNKDSCWYSRKDFELKSSMVNFHSLCLKILLAKSKRLLI